jgi:hypothetical protein
MNRDLHPTDGARYLLELDAELEAGAAARYRATVFTPKSSMSTHLLLRDDGAVTLADGAIAIADPFMATLSTFAKLTARATPKRREDEMPAWPARILRWRR